MGRGRRMDRRGRRASSWSGERHQPYKAGRKPSGTVNRDLVIIPNPNTTKVPSHGSHLKLETRGFVIHEFPICRSWDADKLRNQIEKHLPNEYCLFEYMKACYGTLVTPKLADGVKMSGDILVRLVGQGCIYVRTLFPVTNEDDDEEEDMDLLVNPFDREEKIEETSEGSISSMNEQPSLIIGEPPNANVLGAEVEVIADGNVNEQPNFTEHSIVGLQREINPSAEVQVIDIVPVDDVPQDEAQIDEPVRCIRVHRG
eukprot:Seg4355.5 transcript_id=Seg4355.5/GoldUCD/mRNA.D3Y31 product="hypothetical protein" protein_id=Seg4355.5/GoldUCD/D3Y31